MIGIWTSTNAALIVRLSAPLVARRVVEGRVEDQRVGRAEICAAVAAEEELFLAPVEAHRRLHGAGRECEERAGGAGVERIGAIGAAVEGDAVRADLVDGRHRRRRLRVGEGIHDAGVDQVNERHRVNVAVVEDRFALAAGAGGAEAVVPLREKTERTFECGEVATGVGGRRKRAVPERQRAPAERHRGTAIGFQFREGFHERVEDLGVGRASAGIGEVVERIGDDRPAVHRRRVYGGGARPLVGRETLVRLGATGDQLTGEAVARGDLKGAAEHEIRVLHRLLDHGGAAGIPGGAVFRGGRSPEHLVVGPHAVETGVAGAAGEIDVVDAVHADRPGGIERAGAVGLARAGDRGLDRADGEQRRDRRAAGVGREAAIHLERVDEIALVAAQDFAVRARDRDHEVILVVLQIAETGDGVVAEDVAAALLGHVHGRAGRRALVVVFRMKLMTPPTASVP
jgi:hypothetical protein